MKTKHKIAAVIAAALLTLTACGSSTNESENSATDKPAADTSAAETPAGSTDGAADPSTDAPAAEGGLSGEFVLAAGGGKFRDFLEKNVIAPFLAANPNIDFKYAQSDDSAFASKALFEAGSASGSFSLLLTSSKYVNKLTSEGVLLPVDYTKIAGSDNIIDSLVSEFQMPVLWAPMVIIYNNKYVTEAPTSWADLWNPAYENKTAMLATAEHANEFMYAAASMEAGGYPGPSDWNIPYDKLEALASTSKVYAEQEEMGKGLLTGESWMTVNTLGRAIMWENDPASGADISHVLPKEGTMMFMQSGIIPKNAPNPDAAYEFLSYFLKAQTRVATEFGYLPVAKNVELPADLKDRFTITPEQQALIHQDDPAYITGIEDEWSDFWTRKVVER